MTQAEFMRTLEYLLQDIPDEEKADALQYYRDYFEEAGPEKEMEVSAGFGSPERVASMIRADIAGNLKDGGGFTDRGYEDERFRDPNYEISHRYDLPQEKERKGGRTRTDRGKPWTSRILKMILWFILICVALPTGLGIGGGLFTVVAVIVLVPFIIVFALGLVSVVLCLAGMTAFVGGLIHCITNPIAGLLVIGISLVLMAVGAIFIALSIVVYGKLLPPLIRWVVNCFNRLLHRGRTGA